MNLHLPTLTVALLLGMLLFTLALGVAQRLLLARRELHSWAAGCWALLAGFTIMSLDEPTPRWVPLVGGAALVCGGMALWLQALHRLVGNGVTPRWLVGALAASPLIVAAAVNQPPLRGLALQSLLFALWLMPGVALIARQGWRAERSLRTVAVTLALCALALLAQAALVGTAAPGDAAELRAAPARSALVAFVAVFGASLGFVLAVFERVAGQLDELGMRDAVTGCLSRGATDALLGHELQMGRRQGRTVAFVLLDLDRFRQINDRHGHGIADAVLMQFTRTVRERLRESDVVGRIGGEEFGLVLPGTDAAGARRLAEDIRRAVESIRVAGADGLAVQVTVSAGVATARPNEEIGVEQLYARADQALYAAKRGGRNRVACGDDAAAVAGGASS